MFNYSLEIDQLVERFFDDDNKETKLGSTVNIKHNNTYIFDYLLRPTSASLLTSPAYGFGFWRSPELTSYKYVLIYSKSQALIRYSRKTDPRILTTVKLFL